VRRFFKSLGVVLAGAIGVAILAVPAFAAFTTPADNPHLVPNFTSGPNAGKPAPFDVVVDGYPAVSGVNPKVFEQICDGVDPTDPSWDPSVDCDAGTAGSNAVANGGVASFPAADSNLHIRPFRGESPSSLFNCIAPGDPDPGNGLPTFGGTASSHCTLRTVQDTLGGTTKQQFLQLTLQPAGGPVTPEVPYAVILPLSAVAVGGAFFFLRRRRASRLAA
jgi:hypothetical protein